YQHPEAKTDKEQNTHETESGFQILERSIQCFLVVRSQRSFHLGCKAEQKKKWEKINKRDDNINKRYRRCKRCAIGYVAVRIVSFKYCRKRAHNWSKKNTKQNSHSTNDKPDNRDEFGPSCCFCQVRFTGLVHIHTKER